MLLNSTKHLRRDGNFHDLNGKMVMLYEKEMNFSNSIAILSSTET